MSDTYVYPTGDGEFRTGHRSDSKQKSDKKDKEIKKKALPLKGEDENIKDSVWSKPKYDESKYSSYIDSLLGRFNDPDLTNVNKPDMSIHFNGKFLTIRKVDGDTIVRETYPAVSGRRGDDGEFDNSRERQRMVNQGPIPEGEYWINPQEILRIEDTSFWNQLKGMFGRGYFPGGKYSWGEGKINIYPYKVDVDGVERGNFTVHGGEDPGSAGCIDLMGNDVDFFKFIEKYRGELDRIPITVSYN